MQPSCPYCRAPFEPGDELAACVGCGTTHHVDCLAENGGCTVFGCSQAPVDEAKISVTRQETNAPYPIPQIAAPASPPYSFLNLQNAQPLGNPIAGASNLTAPPPRPSGALLPPPLPSMSISESAYDPANPAAYSSVYPHTFQASQLAAPIPSVTYTPTFSGYAPAAPNPVLYPGYYEPRKSRVVFVMLAVFLGPFGGHNFYAGYTTKAIIQLCLTVLTCFFASFISWIWAIVEACIVDHDNDGIAFV